MPTFLPLIAIDRSANIRIAGQTIKPGKISYVDLGVVDPPGALAFSKSETAAASSLVKSKYYGYAVTAVLGSGETVTTDFKVEKAGAGAEGAGEFNTLTPEWAAVPHAKKYRVYRTALAGAASEAAAKAEAVTLIAEVEATEYLDAGAANKTATPPKTNTATYNVGGYAWSTHKELQNHFAIGQLQQLGGISRTNLDYVPYATEAGFGLVLESEQFKITKSVVVQRSTGKKLAETNELTQASFKSGGATKLKFAVVVYNAADNTVEDLVSAEVTTEPGSALAVATVAKLFEKVLSYHEVLYVVQAKVKVVTNVTGTYLKGNQTPTLGDTTNVPVVASVF